MSYKLEITESAQADFETIYEHLFDSYMDFGDTHEDAFERASARIFSIEHYCRTISKRPQRGTRLPKIQADLKRVTHRDAIYYFRVNEPLKQISVLAIFFGGQDHDTHMHQRLLGDT